MRIVAILAPPIGRPLMPGKACKRKGNVEWPTFYDRERKNAVQSSEGEKVSVNDPPSHFEGDFNYTNEPGVTFERA